MKKLIFLLLTVMFLNINFLAAQDDSSEGKWGKIGITYTAFGENEVVQSVTLDGGRSYNGDFFYTVGVTYVYPINIWLEAETGVEYSEHHITITPSFYPGIDLTPRKADFSIINIPLTLRANFLNYFFVNGGLVINLDNTKNSPIDDQTGIGALLGAALKYDFDFGLSTFINPYLKMNSWIPFNAEKYHQRVLEAGFRFGIMYRL